MKKQKGFAGPGSARLAVLSCLLLMMLAAGCVFPPKPPSPPVTHNQTTVNVTGACNDTACFMAAAGECKDMSVTVTEDAGTFGYSSSPGCVFTKTLIKLNDNETQGMKNLLQGKSMTCAYAKGRFDRRLVTTMVFGLENCTGELRDALGRLVVFSG